MKEQFDLTPVALYARVSSDRQDVDLSVAAPLRALRDYAEKNGARDESETPTPSRSRFGVKCGMSARMFILKEYRHAKALDNL